ncbi:MAG: hypothetical protein ACRERD_24560 [Candidatus Binatia bacterium]
MWHPGHSTHWRGYAMLALVALLLTLVQVWTRLQVVKVGYVLSNTEKLVDTLRGERRALEVEWSTRTASGRLSEQAARRLGLRSAQPGQVITLP